MLALREDARLRLVRLVQRTGAWIDEGRVSELAALRMADWIEPLLHDLRAGGIASAVLDFADGARFTLRARQRWRFWRRPLHSLAA